MNYVFFGSPRFAALALRELLDAGLIPLAVVVNPDRLAGRKKIMTPPEVKTLVLERGLKDRVKIFQPENPSSIVQELSALSPDVFLVAWYFRASD
jgi:methionyl-tRNA formyltransferase